LVLVCVEHAAVIDIPTMLFAYRPDRLSQWKQKQLDDYDRIQQGWVLDTEMAERAIAESASSGGILISHSNISLGGEGGKAPGAGGGGGAGGDGGGSVSQRCYSQIHSRYAMASSSF
jgi:hypothetical protein